MAYGNIVGQSQEIPQSLTNLERFDKGLGNEYIWGKPGYTEVLESPISAHLFIIGTPNIMAYGDSVAFDSQGVATIANPKQYSFDGSEASANQFFLLLKGKYLDTGDTMWKFDTNAEFEIHSSLGDWAIVRSGGYRVSSKKGYTSYVNSPDPNAYPSSEYNLFGQLGGFAKIATGSYVGTGEYGDRYPNTVVLDFAPKAFFIILTTQSTNNIFGLLNISNSICHIKQETGTGGFGELVSFTVEERKIEWYSSSSAFAQGNKADTKYFYFAIG